MIEVSGIVQEVEARLEDTGYIDRKPISVNALVQEVEPRFEDLVWARLPICFNALVIEVEPIFMFSEMFSTYLRIDESIIQSPQLPTNEINEGEELVWE